MRSGLYFVLCCAARSYTLKIGFIAVQSGRSLLPSETDCCLRK